MGTNTENGFHYSVQLFEYSFLANSASVSSGDRFSHRAPDILDAGNVRAHDQVEVRKV